MSFFKTSTGSAITTNGNAEIGGNAEPIPDNTQVRAIITEAKWDSHNGGTAHIKLRWDVVDGEYKKRVVFQKVHVEDADPKKRDRALTMLAAIDFNAGGKLLAKGEKPTDGDLMMNLTNKPMVIRVRIWETDDGKKGNWVSDVGSGKPAAPVATPAAADLDDDIAF